MISVNDKKNAGTHVITVDVKSKEVCTVISVER